jgi:hypothetical protein
MPIHPIPTTLCFLALLFPAAADTFVLNNGSKLEGSILSEDATSYLLEVRVTKTIKDERRILKADVKKIEREYPDQIAFAAIKKLTPTPDLLTPEEYAKRIRAVEKFLGDFRLTSRSKDAEAILATLKAEANEVLAGGIKLNGKIVPAAQYSANAYEIDSRIQAAKIRKLVKNAQSLQALRVFSGFGKDFQNTTAYAELVPLMKQVITSYLQELNQSLTSFEARVKERKVGLERMPTADRRLTENAIREETAELETRFKKEKDAKLDWVTIHPFFKPSLEDTMTFAKQELARLSAMKNQPVVDGGKAFRDAMTLVQSKADAAEITAAIAAAKTAMVPERYMTMLEAGAPGNAANR